MSNYEKMLATGTKAAELSDDSLLAQIVQQTRMTPRDEGYDVAKRGVGAFIAELLKPDNAEERVNKNLVDRMIAELDRKLSEQIDEILHHGEFQKLESAWRGLKLLVDRTDFTQRSEERRVGKECRSQGARER